jgi:hypothetical protein
VYYTKEKYENAFTKAGFERLRTIPLSCHSKSEVE